MRKISRKNKTPWQGKRMSKPKKESKEKLFWKDWQFHTGVKKMTRLEFWELFQRNYKANIPMFRYWDGVLMYGFIMKQAEANKVQNMNGIYNDAGLYISRWVEMDDIVQGIAVVDEIVGLIKKGKTPNSRPWNRKILEPKHRKKPKEIPTPASTFRELRDWKNIPHDAFYWNTVKITGKKMWESFLDLESVEYIQALRDLLKEKSHNDIQKDIKERFEAEVLFIDDAEKEWSDDYNGSVIHDGKASELTLHQKLMPIFLRRNTGFIDLSDPGAGKSDGALHTIANLNTKFNLIVAPAGIINNCQWEDYIKNAFKNATVYKNNDVFSKNFKKNISKDKKNKRRVFYLLSYNFISNSSGNTILNRLKKQGIDFVCVDEGQRTKVRDDKNESKCRRKLENMLTEVRAVKPKIKVLMLTATPVPNTVSECKSLLTLVTGTKKGYDKISTYNNIQNMARMREALALHSLRFAKKYRSKRGNILSKIEKTEKVSQSYNLEGHVKTMKDQGFLGMEQIALEVKLPMMIEKLKAKPKSEKVIIFTKYVTGITNRIAEACDANNISCTFYTGSDKSGLTGSKDFYNGAQVLIASSAISEGIDRLQDYCHELWFIGQGWTWTEREQTIGRIYRTGQTKPVKVLTFEAEINGVEYDKVVKSNRISYKGTIHEMITNGVMPAKISPPEYTMKKLIAQVIKGQPTGKGKKLPIKTVKRLEQMASRSLKAKAARKLRKKHDKKKK